MISVIICSRNADISDELRNNIEETIGIDHEIIVINNSGKKHSLSSAYNEGVRLSNYSILCFMHDDILYHTKNWGATVVNHFKEEDVGMIGVGGTRFLSRTPTIWWAGGIQFIDNEQGIICQYLIDTKRSNTNDSSLISIRPISSASIKVVVLDGLWFCIPKRLFDCISFDQNLFNDFHFYDLDISLQVFSAGYEVHVIYDILVEHISESTLDVEWIESCKRFYKKWRNVLPLSTVKLNQQQKKIIEFENLRHLLNILKSNHYLFNGVMHLPWKVYPLIPLYLLQKTGIMAKK